MKKTISLFLLVACAFLTCYFLLSSSVYAQVQPIPTSTVVADVVELKALETVFNNILAVATSLAGLAVFIMLIMGGFNYLTSGGDPKKTESAKHTITYAVIGLILLIVAWLVLKFIAGFTENPNLLKFEIPT